MPHVLVRESPQNGDSDESLCFGCACTYTMLPRSRSHARSRSSCLSLSLRPSCCLCLSLSLPLALCLCLCLVFSPDNACKAKMTRCRQLCASCTSSAACACQVSYAQDGVGLTHKIPLRVQRGSSQDLASKCAPFRAHHTQTLTRARFRLLVRPLCLRCLLPLGRRRYSRGHLLCCCSWHLLYRHPGGGRFFGARGLRCRLHPLVRF